MARDTVPSVRIIIRHPTGELVRGRVRAMPVTDMVEVYPGYSVTKEKDEERFGGIDLDYFRVHMKPDVFRLFVQGTGIVRGVKGIPDRSGEEYEEED